MSVKRLSGVVYLRARIMNNPEVPSGDRPREIGAVPDAGCPLGALDRGDRATVRQE